MKKLYFALSLLILMTNACKKEAATARKAPIPDQTEINKLKINQLQYLGSHNSYHKHMDQRLFVFLGNLNFLLPEQYKVDELDYYHEPLADQLDEYNLRSFEIDIYADPNGGRFYNRNGNRFVHMTVASNVPALQQPGFKVLHIPDIDYETHYYTFKSMLQALKDWSDLHPNHIPIFILVEGKDQTVGDILGFLGFQTALKFTPALCDDIDTEVKEVFGNELQKIITPDQVRGTYPTLEQAVLADNWPTIGESRGKFIFVMQGASVANYLLGHPSLENRLMFTNSDAGKPEAAFLQYNDASEDVDSIQFFVNKGYMVRTRADGTNNQNRTGDYTEQTAAFNSGAQIISTDYYRPDPRYLTIPNQFKDYSCQFPNHNLARINPISAADKQTIGKVAE